METVDGKGYQIRLASREDVTELVRMQMALQRSMTCLRTDLLHLHRCSTARLHEYYQTQIDDALVRLLVAQDCLSEDVVGMGAGRIWLHPDYVPGRSGELVDLWIDPAHRRQGLASRVVTRLLRFFRNNRVEFLAVNYVQGNPLAANLWAKLGFETVLVTATAERKEVESTLGTGSPCIVSVPALSATVDRPAYSSISRLREPVA